MQLSIVTTLYNSGPYVEEFCSRSFAEAERKFDDIEIILVDDGSGDDSLAIATRCRQSDPRIKVVELSRNFGHHKAMMVGLRLSIGQQVFVLDSDLEEAPEWLSMFIDVGRAAGADIVIGAQTGRQGSLVKRFGGFAFYACFNLISTIALPPGTTCARLMNRAFTDALLQHSEREPFFAGLCQLTGFRQCTVEVNKPYKGATTYGLVRRIRQAVDALAAFSTVPLYAIGVLGSIICIVCVLHLCLTNLRAPLIASIWAVGGLGMVCTGIIGVYLGQILAEVKNRPTLIKKTLGVDIAKFE